MKIEDKEYLRAAKKIWCGDECTIQNVSHCEDFTVTPKLRYKKKEIDLGDGTAKTEYRLQQMWQGSGGTEDWQWVQCVD